jgi:phosphoglycerate dehydrogenase-like enzyme
MYLKEEMAFSWISGAYAANAIPTAEYALAQTLFSLKRGWYYAMSTRERSGYPPRIPVAGGYESTVGLVSLGMIGMYVGRLLQPFDANLLAYTSSQDKADQLGAERCSLDDLFRRADVISLHTPWLEETEG